MASPSDNDNGYLWNVVRFQTEQLQQLSLCVELSRQYPNRPGMMEGDKNGGDGEGCSRGRISLAVDWGVGTGGL